jgi:hypothetical protein
MVWNWGTTIYIWLFDVVWGFKRTLKWDAANVVAP